MAGGNGAVFELLSRVFAIHFPIIVFLSTTEDQFINIGAGACCYITQLQLAVLHLTLHSYGLGCG